MSARNGQRARFHRNRKRRVLQRMKVREVRAALTQETADAASATTATKPGPALKGR
jgi:hypothetical protein